jgi:hypothetical protein
MTPTEDDGSKRRALAPVTRKKRLPEALSWRLWGAGGEVSLGVRRKAPREQREG